VVAEDKEGPVTHILMQRRGRQRGKPLKTLAHVRWLEAVVAGEQKPPAGEQDAIMLH